MKKILYIMLSVIIFSCSTDDEPSNTPIVGGPTDVADDDDSSNDGQDNSGNPFLYNPTTDLKSLVDYPIGNIVSATKLTSTSAANQSFRGLLLDDFNSITAENDMKMANIFRGPDNYDYSDGDAIVAFAKANGIRVFGHTLVWHASIPGWLNSFEGTDEEFSTLIENYVKATVTHFAQEKMIVNGEEVSVVSGWDVVNEVFEGGGLRSTLFQSRMGPDYVSKLFTWAREADADVKLFYNDYNMEFEAAKRNAMLNMVSNFQENNIPIDGIGFQMHVNHDFPSRSDMTEATNSAIATGLLIHFSELDVKVNYNNDITEFTQARADAQEAQYRTVAEIYNTVPAAQQYGLTIWGMRDNDSWLYDNGSDWPLMYDNEFNYKIAHRGFSQGLQSN